MYKAYNKGGRPTKSNIEKRNYRVNIKMNTEEYYTLKARASEAGTSLSDFIRLIIVTSEIKQRLSPELLDLVRKLCGMANNLNQIAHKANTTGYREARIEYLFLAEKIDNLLDLIQK